MTSDKNTITLEDFYNLLKGIELPKGKYGY